TYRAESIYRLEKTGIGREPLLFRVHYWVRGIAECVSAAITPRMSLTSFQTYALLPPPGDVNESDYFTVLRGFFPMDTLYGCFFSEFIVLTLFFVLFSLNVV